MGKSDIKQQVFEQDPVQEDLFEAIIGAVAHDTKWDLNVLSNVVDLMLDPNFYLENGFDEPKNYVELLKQWCQKNHRMIPVYCYKNTGGFPSAGKRGKYECRLGLPLGKGFWGVADTKSEARMAVAEQAYRHLEANGLLDISWIDEIGEPNIDRAINQLQELYQKGYIGEPWYDFSEMHDEDGNPIWHCECHVDGREVYFEGEHTSKKNGKKAVAYDMLCDILGWEENYET